MSNTEAENKIKKAVRDAYGQIARGVSDEPIRVVRASCCARLAMMRRSGLKSPPGAACCGPSGQVVEAADAARLYPAEDCRRPAGYLSPALRWGAATPSPSPTSGRGRLCSTWDRVAASTAFSRQSEWAPPGGSSGWT